MNGDEEVMIDQGQASFDAGNAGKMNPSNYRDPMINEGNPQVTRDVNESAKRQEPTHKGKPKPHADARERAKDKKIVERVRKGHSK